MLEFQILIKEAEVIWTQIIALKAFRRHQMCGNQDQDKKVLGVTREMFLEVHKDPFPDLETLFLPISYMDVKGTGEAQDDDIVSTEVTSPITRSYRFYFSSPGGWGDGGLTADAFRLKHSGEKVHAMSIPETPSLEQFISIDAARARHEDSEGQIRQQGPRSSGAQ